MYKDPTDLRIIRIALMTVLLLVLVVPIFELYEEVTTLPCGARDKEGNLLVICDPPFDRNTDEMPYSVGWEVSSEQ